MEGERDNQRDFEQQWQEWATRPPTLTAEEAAEAIQRRLQSARPARGARWAVAAAAALVAVAAGLSLYLRDRTPDRQAVAQATAVASRLGPGEVLMWLDDETPLYMTFQLSNGAYESNGGPR